MNSPESFSNINFPVSERLAQLIQTTMAWIGVQPRQSAVSSSAEFTSLAYAF
jgi:hypothetical protein